MGVASIGNDGQGERRGAQGQCGWSSTSAGDTEGHGGSVVVCGWVREMWGQCRWVQGMTRGVGAMWTGNEGRGERRGAWGQCGWVRGMWGQRRWVRGTTRGAGAMWTGVGDGGGHGGSVDERGGGMGGVNGHGAHRQMQGRCRWAWGRHGWPSMGEGDDEGHGRRWARGTWGRRRRSSLGTGDMGMASLGAGDIGRASLGAGDIGTASLAAGDAEGRGDGVIGRGGCRGALTRTGEGDRGGGMGGESEGMVVVEKQGWGGVAMWYTAMSRERTARMMPE
ncbi:hypothetical protein BDN71DRAFT_1570479 [Pleurotus eryngii]|uniref:Uncharacterized protein n=1 Tax=Pleurotus eryngii TaxID=5323 RepID=A0A9P5ZT71_PLEER|nr:hypothetical protein BDN71DRAFT_1570479 [Pleurotus eryngii]